MSFIAATNFVSVSVSTPPTGLKEYQVNNLAIFTKEVPVNGAITAAAPGIYVSPTDVATDWGSTSEVYAQAVLIFSQSPNILDGLGTLIISPMASGDLLKDVIPAALLLNFFGGALWAGYDPADAEIIAAATACEPLRVKLFASSYLTSALTTTTGLFWIITNATENHTRCLLYTEGGTTLAARKMAAAYAGRAMSTNFDGVATTLNMHGKSLVGITGDTGISQATLNTCIAIGVDTYPLVGGGAQYLGKVFTSGFNGYFDDVYNLDWLVFGLQVAGFNALTTVSTKLPQTEPGMAVLKGAYIAVLQQAIINGFVAPGVWNSPELFGNPTDLKRNILNIGYYIYSQPVNQQAQAARVARQAPLVQIAIKFAGAINSSSVVVSVNQ
jgi:hypothetical protein